MRYRISEKAIADLEQIWVYTYNNWSLDQADRYHKQIFNEIEYIAVNIEYGKNMDHVRLGYRMTKVKSHLIFYREIDIHTVEVVRILHQNMDIENRLKE